MDRNVPRVKADLVSLPRTLLLKLKVVNRPPTLRQGKCLDEIFIIPGRGSFGNNDFRVVCVEREDDKLIFPARLE